MKRWIDLGVIAALILLVILSAACGSTGSGGNSSALLAPVSVLPAEMQNAPARVREAYQFAVAHPDALKKVPCYCGCGSIGHTSNYACYIKEQKPDGAIVFDEHALGCSICVDIAQDVLRLTREGKSPGDIRSFIVNTYSRFGPSNQ